MTDYLRQHKFESFGILNQKRKNGQTSFYRQTSCSNESCSLPLIPVTSYFVGVIVFFLSRIYLLFLSFYHHTYDHIR
jgi:hypothetical protein